MHNQSAEMPETELKQRKSLKSTESLEARLPFLSKGKDSPTSVAPSESVNEAMWRDVAEITKKELVRQFDSVLEENLQDMVNRALDCNRLISEPASDANTVDWMSEKTKDKHLKAGQELPEKVFMHRESVLTDLLKVSHIRAIYHMFAAILILIAAETMLSDFLDIGSFREKYHVEMFRWVFGKTSHTIAIWLGMQLSTLCVYPLFMFWAKNRSKSGHMTILDKLILMAYIGYQLFFMTFFGWLVFELELPPGSSIMLGMELSRFMMKSHAFVRSNIPKAFQYTRIENRKESTGPHENLDQTLLEDESQSHEKLKQMLHTLDYNSKMASGSICPRFSHFLYFLFAPTLVYRDSYPRTNRIRWSFVFSNGLQFVLCVFYTYFILFRFCFGKFESFGERTLTTSEVLRLILSCMLPGGMLMYLAFFSFLHSWLNMFAELLTFGDRLFYKDWWNSRSFSTYYRTWNVVVHDWLYTYIYCDVYKLTKSRGLATTLVFAISAYMHEYILCMTFKFFYPVLLILFGGAGFILVFFKTRNRFWNLSFFANMCLGLGIEIALYANEWYARKYCGSLYPDNYWMDFVVPRTIFCVPTKK